MHRLFGIALGILLLALGAQGAAHAAGLKDYEACTTNQGCNSGACAASRCIPASGLATGRICDKDANCQSHACLTTAQGSRVCSAQPKVAGSAAPQGSIVNGEACKAGAECQSNYCFNRNLSAKHCAPAKLMPGFFCINDSDCVFGACRAAPGTALRYCVQPGLPLMGAADLEYCDASTACMSRECGWASGDRKLKRCIPQSRLTYGSACHDGKDCANRACLVAGTQTEMACR